ncbi:H-NS family nucleoid-associated regulatory protein [Photobacterium damselae]|uniref:H-NS family histone-like protein n=1 Tax=Photobacterium damselae TaxID=38293 RepID=UPI000A2FB7FA|nr:H-NS family nucleoid-associated regulatory protein [Photobacterium damselae]ARR51939.1 transcriptional regulator [Photobacterium damselae subsp. damselae]
MSTLDFLFKIRTLRTLSREYSLKQLQEALDKLNQVVRERVQQEEQYRAENKEREEKLEVYRQMLIADGINPEELLSSINSAPIKSKRKPRPAKYSYVENGEEKTWTGQGRTPKFLEGKNLDEFLI